MPFAIPFAYLSSFDQHQIIYQMNLGVFRLVVNAFCTNASHTVYTHQKLLRQYFRERMLYTPKQSLDLFFEIHKEEASLHVLQDHRYISLLQGIEKNLRVLPMSARMQILHKLAEFNEYNTLFMAIHEQAANNIGALTWKETVEIMWSAVKLKKMQKELMVRLCDRLKELLSLKITIVKENKHNNKNQQIQKQQILNKTSKEQQIVGQPQNALSIRMVDVFRPIYCMAKTNMIDYWLLNGLIPIIEENMSSLSLYMKCSILHYLLTLEQAKSPLVFALYRDIRSNSVELEALPNISLMELIESIGIMIEAANHKIQKKIKKDNFKIEWIQEMQDQMRKMALWIAETLLLTEGIDRKSYAARILLALSKSQAFDLIIYQQYLTEITTSIANCKVIDISMSLRAICELSQSDRSKLIHFQKKILARVWIIYHSFTHKSKSTLFNLIEQNKIRIPKEMLTTVTQDIRQRRAKSSQKAKTKEESASNQFQEQFQQQEDRPPVKHADRDPRRKSTK